MTIYRSIRSMVRPGPSSRQASETGYKGLYGRFVRQLTRSDGYDRAMRMSVGGDFEAFGLLERDLLIHYGLSDCKYLIDVGCGSGRLAVVLRQSYRGDYLGTDVVPELLDYARKLVPDEKWRFELVEGFSIPASAGSADMVCFFSVFTHLLHDQSYIYLSEAKRVLKSGGKIIFSFLDYSIPSHWAVFEETVRQGGNSPILNVFLNKDAIKIWAESLGFKVQDIRDGDQPFIPLSNSVRLDDGTVMEGLGNLGQSVCVLSL